MPASGTPSAAAPATQPAAAPASSAAPAAAPPECGSSRSGSQRDLPAAQLISRLLSRDAAYQLEWVQSTERTENCVDAPAALVLTDTDPAGFVTRAVTVWGPRSTPVGYANLTVDSPATPTTIRGVPTRVVKVGGGLRIGWTEPGGRSWEITGAGLTQQQIQSIAGTLQISGDVVTLPEVPAGFTAQVRPAAAEPPDLTTREWFLSYKSGSLLLRAVERHRLFAESASYSVRGPRMQLTTVRGRPASFYGTPQSSFLSWEERPGLYVSLTANGTPQDKLKAFAESLEEVEASDSRITAKLRSSSDGNEVPQSDAMLAATKTTANCINGKRLAGRDVAPAEAKARFLSTDPAYQIEGLNSLEMSALCPEPPAALVLSDVSPDGTVTRAVTVWGPRRSHGRRLAAAKPITVRGVDAEIMKSYLGHLRITWVEPGGTAWEIDGAGVSQEELAAIADKLEITGNAATLAEPPTGFTAEPALAADLRVAARWQQWGGSHKSSKHQLQLKVSGQPRALGQLSADQSTNIRRFLEVRGHRAVLDMGNHLGLVWEERPGLWIDITMYDGRSEDVPDLVAFAESLEPVAADDPRIAPKLNKWGTAK